MLWEAIVGPGAQHSADLEIQGPVRVDGCLLGSLVSTDFVEVGLDGRVEGDLSAPQLLIGGVVVGAVRASERVTLLPSARVVGTLVSPWLDAQLGAQVEGTVTVRREGR